jgi:hypothetical protein
LAVSEAISALEWQEESLEKPNRCPIHAKTNDHEMQVSKADDLIGLVEFY